MQQRTHNPQLHTRPATWKTAAQNTTRSNHCIMLLSSWWWAWWRPKHVEQAIRSAIKTSVACSWHFISTYFWTTFNRRHLLSKILHVPLVLFISTCVTNTNKIHSFSISRNSISGTEKGVQNKPCEHHFRAFRPVFDNTRITPRRFQCDIC